MLYLLPGRLGMSHDRLASRVRQRLEAGCAGRRSLLVFRSACLVYETSDDHRQACTLNSAELLSATIKQRRLGLFLLLLLGFRNSRLANPCLGGSLTSSPLWDARKIACNCNGILVLMIGAGVLLLEVSKGFMVTVCGVL
jgi:hypothetical protein